MLQRIDPLRPDGLIIARAAEILRSGGLVAFPTETVYGLGANALDPSAVERIYAAKGRPAYNPLIVHVGDATQVSEIAREWPERAERLARTFWPGPLTLVVAKRANVPAGVTAGLDSVAVRVPSHPVALALLAAARVPVAAPSANRSTEVSPTTGSHVEKSLGDAVDLILDAGPTTVGIESTVVDVTVDPPVVLRPGMITRQQLTGIIGDLADAPLRGATGTDARRSPGMLDRHYAPRAKLFVADDARTREIFDQARAAGTRVAAIVRASSSFGTRGDSIVDLPDDPAGYAAGLYAALHQLDEAGAEIIVVQRPPDAPEWNAVLDRLDRAAHKTN